MALADQRLLLQLLQPLRLQGLQRLLARHFQVHQILTSNESKISSGLLSGLPWTFVSFGPAATTNLLGCRDCGPGLGCRDCGPGPGLGCRDCGPGLGCRDCGPGLDGSRSHQSSCASWRLHLADLAFPNLKQLDLRSSCLSPDLGVPSCLSPDLGVPSCLRLGLAVPASCLRLGLGVPASCLRLDLGVPSCRCLGVRCRCLGVPSCLKPVVVASWCGPS